MKCHCVNVCDSETVSVGTECHIRMSQSIDVAGTVRLSLSRPYKALVCFP